MNMNIKLEELVLSNGSHKSPEDGLCVMEAVAYFAGEKHSDRPECACPVLALYMMNLNDNMNNEERKMLNPYILKLIGTKDGNSQKRMQILVKHAIVKVAPHALRLAGLPEHAEKLEAFDKPGEMDYDAVRYAATDASYAARAAVRYAASAASYAVSAAASRASDASAAASRASDASAAASDVRYAASYAARAAVGAASAASSAATYYADNAANTAARLEYWKMALNALDEALEVK